MNKNNKRRFEMSKICKFKPLDIFVNMVDFIIEMKNKYSEITNITLKKAGKKFDIVEYVNDGINSYLVILPLTQVSLSLDFPVIQDFLIFPHLS